MAASNTWRSAARADASVKAMANFLFCLMSKARMRHGHETNLGLIAFSESPSEAAWLENAQTSMAKSRQMGHL
jgi:hypothetical protein